MRFSELQLALAALAGGGVGFLSGVFGFGGGFLLVPVLHIVLRIPMALAVGAGACQALGPATTALLARGVGRAGLRLPLTIAGGLLVGVLLGVETLAALGGGPERSGDDSTATADAVVLASYFALLTGLGAFAIWEVRRYEAGRPLPRGWIAGWLVPPVAPFREFGGRSVSVTVIAWFGLAVGFLSGLLGMSGGIVLFPGLIYLLGMRTHQAVLSSLVIVWLTTAQATIAHAWRGNVDLRLVAALLVGGTIGARLGSEVGVRTAGPRLRRFFGWLLLATATGIGARLVVLVVG